MAMQMPAGLSDKDMVGDLLSTVKQMSSGYHMALLESVNQELRNTFSSLHDDQVTQARRLFDVMHQRGWYKVQ